MKEKVILAFVLVCLGLFGFRGILPEVPILGFIVLFIIAGLIGSYYHFNYSKNKRKTGSIAVSKGWLSPDEVKEIVYCQKYEGEKFGEVAIQRNFLTTQQVDSILEIQTTLV
ncbi:MAG: hypothetical protein BV456_10830 [Thermoplasmata archaeon M8B2D]|nr:MAG: hypothetical protein BV456_10830 [Thermoplasmata archaeon M8B2D]